MSGVSHLLLRIGAAFAFLYPPVAALLDPVSWLAYFPPFLRALPVPEMALLHGFGILEVLIAFWILSGKRIFVPSALATLLLLGIVLFNWNQLDVLFRDLSLAALTGALALDAWRKERQPVTLTT